MTLILTVEQAGDGYRIQAPSDLEGLEDVAAAVLFFFQQRNVDLFKALDEAASYRVRSEATIPQPYLKGGAA